MKAIHTGLTREAVAELLMTNDKAVGRALVVLRNRQTIDERRDETTRYLNGRGFRPAHARKGTSMAEFFETRGFLTAKQVAYWRRPMADGNPRIVVYWAQLIEEAELKAAARAASRPTDWDRVVSDEREMQRMEAAGDRAQTAQDEANKRLARDFMERAANARMAG